ncbi:MAG: hypothetical protein H0W17_02970 [Chloroflexi bacterium]|nr:hypothetical protein [Chloroflexota bacterium]
MPRAWLGIAWVTAALALVGAVLPLFDVYPFDIMLVALVAGILIPIWAVWFASRARAMWPSAELYTEPVAA